MYIVKLTLQQIWLTSIITHIYEFLSFLVVRTFKVYCHKLLNIQYNFIKYSHPVVHYVPMTYFITGSFYLLTTLTPNPGASQVAQWLRNPPANAGGLSSILG